jgi:hypothetical protein
MSSSFLLGLLPEYVRGCYCVGFVAKNLANHLLEKVLGWYYLFFVPINSTYFLEFVLVC